MEFLTSLGGGAGWLLGYLIPFLFVLTIVVFFHELGHFWVARRAGVKVVAFSLGFGPEIAGFNDRHGTRWRLAAIPLGGYVKFLGDENAASAPDRGAINRMSATDREGASSTSRSAPAPPSSPPGPSPISSWRSSSSPACS